MKILKTIRVEVENALRIRFIEPFSTEEYINSLEEIVTRTNIGRTWKKVGIKLPNKPFMNKYKPKYPFKSNSTREKIKCHKCGGIGSLANDCPKKGKINEIMKTEDQNDKEEASDFER
ncbi:hypothetical protein O181_077085 [Austropuccinia psidii MF-1]|uniref:CCHC-type domain-containing protein n=1 Tax=Austropuccinia psidii MF-1 TaxID=1389203 RepID=A0A9Q3IFM7_9BASI|nr:hypothetical protein [Austropuccinia psidii MF-1]